MFASLRRTLVSGLGVTALLLGLVEGSPAEDGYAGIPGRGCGTYIPPDKAIAFEKQFRELQKRQTGPTTVAPRLFDIYWTVVTTNETVDGGRIPEAQMKAQIEILNNDYAEAQISWRLAGFKYVHNRDWFENAWQQTTQEREMKYLFRTGGVSEMNLYTIGFNSTSEILGYTTIPQLFADDPVADGVVVRYTTMPGGSQQYYNFGRTLTHESGHWLGLYHTFQGGCDGDGDFVADTPPEAIASKGCPIGRDTCPGGGPDPVQSFMDYSVDQCMTGFTPGQIERMHRFIEGYRQPTNINYTFPYWTDQGVPPI